jgi:TolB-like protein/Tfp pilus assembly protein PilF
MEVPAEPATEKKKGKKKKVRSVALGIFVATRLHWPRVPEPAPPPTAPAVARSPSAMLSIAVLPLQNLSGDPKQEYFADGMTDALIADLAQMRGARVISRTSSMSYKSQQKTLPQIAQELGVDFIVEGSVVRAGDRVRVTAQLIDARTDEHVWAHAYDHRVRDVLTLQGQAATQIAAAVKGALSPTQQSRLAARQPIDPVSYDLYLRGRYAWNLRTPEGYRDAVAAFEQAIAKDPDFALAHAGLADTYSLMSAGSRKDLDAKAKAAALRALQLDDGLAEAHTSLAAVYHRAEGRRDEAERQFQQALALNPGYATAHQWYAILLAEDGRDAEALAQAEHAVRVDPLSSTMHMTLGLIHYYARRFEKAEEEERRALELRAQPFARHFLARALLALGRPAEAAALYAPDSPPPTPDGLAVLAVAHHRLGDGARADALRKQLLGMSPLPTVALARFHVSVGDREAALQMIEKTAESDPVALRTLIADPAFDPLRADPRFAGVVARARQG